MGWLGSRPASEGIWEDTPPYHLPLSPPTATQPLSCLHYQRLQFLAPK